MSEIPNIVSYIGKNLRKNATKECEIYVISRIWHRLNRNDVRFVFQQYMNIDGIAYLADLYLPQIKLVVEVNEPFHKKQTAKDNARNSAIRAQVVKLVKVEIVEDVEMLHKRIDEVVGMIESMIAEMGDKFEPWNDAMFEPEYYIKKGVLDVADMPMVRTIEQVAKIFGRKAPQQRGEIKLGNNKIVWWPKQGHKDWNNVPEFDENRVIAYMIEYPTSANSETAEHHLNRYIDKDETRITFFKEKDVFGQRYYRFVGVYKLDRERSRKEKKCCWKLVKDTYSLK